ncbi:MAG: ornithine cyclodeaminase [Acidobacteria bacterium]|nr:MAG: ornithine cyclodeaminase [Acidobacteriota bacterium]
MLFLAQADVQRLLDTDRLIEALVPAMAELSAGRVSMPARIGAEVPGAKGVLGVMPVYLPSAASLVTKLVSVFPKNAGGPHPTHQALIAVFDAETGAPLAVMDGTLITAARTAAGSALATRWLARPDAGVLAIVGTGVQARAHARAIPRVRPIRRVRVAGRDEREVARLAEELREELRLPIEAAKTIRAAIAGADIICATTHSPEPVIRGEWLEPGVHVNSVGFNPEGREVDAETVQKAVVVVESRQAALAPYPSGANDLIWPIRDGLITAAHIHAEIGEIVSGTRPGRSSREEITLYKSVGVAVQDAVAAGLVLEAARKQKTGQEIEL